MELFHKIIEKKETAKKNKDKKFIFRDEESEVDSIEDLVDRAEFSDNSEATETEEENNADEF